jgi:hypothetical protein
MIRDFKPDSIWHRSRRRLFYAGEYIRRSTLVGATRVPFGERRIRQALFQSERRSRKLGVEKTSVLLWIAWIELVSQPSGPKRILLSS